MTVSANVEREREREREREGWKGDWTVTKNGIASVLI
jgi:hypothetical protein